MLSDVSSVGSSGGVIGDSTTLVIGSDLLDSVLLGCFGSPIVFICSTLITVVLLFTRFGLKAGSFAQLIVINL